jgi:hypothetical protein
MAFFQIKKAFIGLPSLFSCRQVVKFRQKRKKSLADIINKEK